MKRIFLGCAILIAAAFFLVSLQQGAALRGKANPEQAKPSFSTAGDVVADSDSTNYPARLSSARESQPPTRGDLASEEGSDGGGEGDAEWRQFQYNRRALLQLLNSGGWEAIRAGAWKNCHLNPRTSYVPPAYREMIDFGRSLFQEYRAAVSARRAQQFAELEAMAMAGQLIPLEQQVDPKKFRRREGMIRSLYSGSPPTEVERRVADAAKWSPTTWKGAADKDVVMAVDGRFYAVKFEQLPKTSILIEAEREARQKIAEFLVATFAFANALTKKEGGALSEKIRVAPVLTHH
ncbi:MAG: hypothetical protein ACE37K_22925 [Planctomycetota bacterium]